MASLWIIAAPLLTLLFGTAILIFIGVIGLSLLNAINDDSVVAMITVVIGVILLGSLLKLDGRPVDYMLPMLAQGLAGAVALSCLASLPFILLNRRHKAIYEPTVLLLGTLMPRDLKALLKALWSLLWRIGALLLLGGLIWWPFLFALEVAPILTWIGLLLLIIAVRARVSAFLLTTFRQFRARLQRNTAELLRRDTRRPILFLRAFSDDGIATGRFGGKPISLIFGSNLGVMRLEECIESVAHKFGPLIAINRPGTSLPPLGAARENVEGDWRVAVSKYVESCQIIVVI